MVKFKFLAQFPVDHIAHPVVSLCANLLHSLIMGLIILSLSPHNIHLLFCCVLSSFALTWFLWHCFVLLLEKIQFLLRFPFLSYVHVFMCEILLITWNIDTVIFLLVFLTDSKSTSTQVCEALCIITSFLVLWSICWSSSLIHFKNSPEYLTREKTFWWDFCCRAWFWKVFSFVWDTIF